MLAGQSDTVFSWAGASDCVTSVIRYRLLLPSCARCAATVIKCLLGGHLVFAAVAAYGMSKALTLDIEGQNVIHQCFAVFHKARIIQRNPQLCQGNDDLGCAFNIILVPAGIPTFAVLQL